MVYTTAYGRRLMDELAGVLLAVIFFVFAISMMVWRFSRSRKMVERWASDNCMELIEAQRRFLCRGTYWWRTGKGQEVFRITVRDGSGQVRCGYVRVGSFFLGLLIDQVDVEWD